MSKAEQLFEFQLKASKLAGFVTQYRLFAELVGAGKGLRARLSAKGYKDYRYDFAHIEKRVAVEINGSVWQKGGHNTGKGLIRDYDKLNQAQLQGWQVYIFTPQQVKSGHAINTILQLLRPVKKLCK